LSNLPPNQKPGFDGVGVADLLKAAKQP